MKRTFRALSVVLILLVVFSATAFAAPAPPVSQVQITGASINSDGNVYVTVRVTGYGQPFATWDGGQITDYDIQTIGKPTVTGFYYIYNCGKAVKGSHTFKFSIRSFNSPWNTLNVSGTYTIS